MSNELKMYLSFDQLLDTERAHQKNNMRLIQSRIDEIRNTEGSDFEIRQLIDYNESVRKYLSEINNLYFIK